MKKLLLVSVLFMSLLAVSCSQPSNGISRSQDNWLADSVPSIKQTYSDTFDYIGLAVEYGNFGLKYTGNNKYTGTYTHDKSWGTPSELYYSEVQQGISKHANTITLGNELKPQFLLQWWDGDGSSQSKKTFTASNGKTIDVPDKLKGEALIYATLNAAKKSGVKMRGHVLTWHSQTPEGFFREKYSKDGALVSEEVMTARHEWYIKTVLDCVAQWEIHNGYAGKGTGNHLIWAWDVVNEAMADDASDPSTDSWLRGSTAGTKDKDPANGGSRWYEIYKNEEFIINAFRFANAYAPADVKLCYNDYNEYQSNKTPAIEKIANLIKAGSAQTINGKSVSPRLDAIAMQSHVGSSWPSITEYENALKKFLAIADVHVSELDFNATSQNDAEKVYGEYFKMLKKYGKNYNGTHKITCVTIWGINNENSWINPNSDGNTTYPLLFSKTGETYDTNNSFWAVINSH
nr:endo-1,4-beta-xylanase [uncultured Treponema sp.]